jgi:Negative regulator of sigma F
MAVLAVAVLSCIVVVLASELVYQRLAVGLSVNATSVGKLQWTLALLAVMTIVSTGVALWRGRHGFGAGAVGLAVAGVLVTPIYALLTVLHPIHAHDASILNVTISPWGVRCALIAGIIGAVAIFCFAMALRHAVPVASRLRGAAIGAAAGAWAGLAVFVFCPSGDPQHLIAGHVLPVIALTVIGMIVTPRLLRP